MLCDGVEKVVGMGVLWSGENAASCSIWLGASSMLEDTYGGLETGIPICLHPCVKSLSAVKATCGRTWICRGANVWQLISGMFMIQLSLQDYKIKHL